MVCSRIIKLELHIVSLVRFHRVHKILEQVLVIGAFGVGGIVCLTFSWKEKVNLFHTVSSAFAALAKVGERVTCILFFEQTVANLKHKSKT